jgi:glycosyltransferase involved in cell wall biosynthesis
MAMAQRVIISVTSDLSNDQRVDRMASALMEMGFTVSLVGRQRRDSPPLEPRAYPARRLRFYFERGKLFYLMYALKMFWWLLFQRVDILLANDLDTMLPNFLVAKLRRKTLVYDSHEYWTEVPELIHRPLARAAWHLLEKWTFPGVDPAITVNQSIAAIYEKSYGLKVNVIRNLPLTVPAVQTVRDRGKTLIYQGALNVGRGIELMIGAMAFLPEYRLVIAGYGPLEEQIRRSAASMPQSHQILFRGLVPPARLREETASAMLGMSLEEDLGMSYHLALPNKLFDYIQAGVPVLASDLPEMAAVVRLHRVGELLGAAERTPEMLAARIRRLCENGDKLAEYTANCQRAAKILNWESEQQKVRELFRPLL